MLFRKLQWFFATCQLSAFKHYNISISYMQSYADNVSYMNGLLSTSDKDRSYNQERFSIAFSIQKISLFNQKISTGIYSNFESRNFSSNIEDDKLHYKRSHQDISINYWIKRHLNDYIDIKLKNVHRARNTSSEEEYVNDLKSFSKFEIWLSLILKMELDVY